MGMRTKCAADARFTFAVGSWKRERERERGEEDRCSLLLSLQTTPTKRKETGERASERDRVRDAGERREERNICHSGMDGRC